MSPFSSRQHQKRLVVAQTKLWHHFVQFTKLTATPPHPVAPVGAVVTLTRDNKSLLTTTTIEKAKMKLGMCVVGHSHKRNAATLAEDTVPSEPGVHDRQKGYRLAHGKGSRRNVGHAAEEPRTSKTELRFPHGIVRSKTQRPLAFRLRGRWRVEFMTDSD